VKLLTLHRHNWSPWADADPEDPDEGWVQVRFCAGCPAQQSRWLP
jgi:hypothetical protein